MLLLSADLASLEESSCLWYWPGLFADDLGQLVGRVERFTFGLRNGYL